MAGQKTARTLKKSTAFDLHAFLDSAGLERTVVM